MIIRPCRIGEANSCSMAGRDTQITSFCTSAHVNQDLEKASISAAICALAPTGASYRVHPSSQPDLARGTPTRRGCLVALASPIVQIGPVLELRGSSATGTSCLRCTRWSSKSGLPCRNVRLNPRPDAVVGMLAGHVVSKAVAGTGTPGDTPGTPGARSALHPAFSPAGKRHAKA
jgi:hypothetical protein